MVAALVVLAVAAYFIARTVAHSFIQSEISTRSDWEIDTGDVADREAAQQVTVYTDPVEATIEITQIVPDEYEDEGFTYYDEEVQDRLASTLLGLTQEAYQAAAPDELEARKRSAADRYREAGADLVIDSILELPAAIDELNRRLARKEAAV